MLSIARRNKVQRQLVRPPPQGITTYIYIYIYIYMEGDKLQKA